MEKQRVSLDLFLKSLYRGFEESSSFVEVRCIHPLKTHACSFWFQVGHDYFYRETMKRAAKMNADGYGVFFCPALRTTMSRDFDHTRYLPALWLEIDCDDDPSKREQAWKRLLNFDLLPSVIVDSGGGWHVYYFLDASKPCEMQSHDERQEMGLYLKGLSQALGGDEAYARSVASPMRLPSLVNTKPERNKRVRFAYFQPEHVYSLEEFTWLKLERSVVEKPFVRLKTDQDKRRLPQRTKQYLVSGAASGERNRELFLAACQFRDNGYTQLEAELQLIAVYLRDSLQGEMLGAREAEARKTISSVYRQPARSPIGGD